LERVARDSYPEPLARRYYYKKLDFWYQNYLQTLLVKNVKDISNIEQIGVLPLLLKTLAGRVGNILNFTDLSGTMKSLNTKTLT
jgi:hypothetical protein